MLKRCCVLLVLMPSPFFFLQQWRLIPFLAAAHVFNYYSAALYREFVSFHIAVLFGEKSPEVVSAASIHSHVREYEIGLVVGL